MEQRNPWRCLGSREVYQNPWMRVREDDVIRPDGSRGIYGVIDTRIATGVVALSSRDEVYLVGQWRYPTSMYSWEIIEGGADEGESALAAAQRELREEAGLVADSWEQLGAEVHLSNCITAERAYLFLARGLHAVEASPEGTEVLEVRSVPFAEALALVHDGTIKDAVSIIGLLRAEKVRG